MNRSTAPRTSNYEQDTVKAIDEVHCEGFFDAPIGFKKCPALDELKAARDLQQRYVDSLKKTP